jgi:hypothetical protein
VLHALVDAVGQDLRMHRSDSHTAGRSIGSIDRSIDDGNNTRSDPRPKSFLLLHSDRIWIRIRIRMDGFGLRLSVLDSYRLL